MRLDDQDIKLGTWTEFILGRMSSLELHSVQNQVHFQSYSKRRSHEQDSIQQHGTDALGRQFRPS